MSGHVFVCVRGIDFAIFYDFFYCVLEMFDSVVFCVFLLGFRNVRTVWYFVFFYWVLEMFGQCGILCFSIGF